MNKYTFFLTNCILILLCTQVYCEPENHQPQPKIHIVLKKEPGVWDSPPIKLVRHIGFYGLSLVGYLQLLEALVGPFIIKGPPRMSLEGLLPTLGPLVVKTPLRIFLEGLSLSAVSLGIAQLIKVKDEESPIIISDGKVNNNFVIIRQ